jgi:hypothetical protein
MCVVEVRIHIFFFFVSARMKIGREESEDMESLSGQVLDDCEVLAQGGVGELKAAKAKNVSRPRGGVES